MPISHSHRRVTVPAARGRILFKGREMLPDPRLIPGSALPALSVVRWTGETLSKQAGDGVADFGCDEITDCYPDLGNTSRISCSNLGEFPPTTSGGTFLCSGRADC